MTDFAAAWRRRDQTHSRIGLTYWKRDFKRKRRSFTCERTELTHSRVGMRTAGANGRAQKRDRRMGEGICAWETERNEQEVRKLTIRARHR